MLCIAVTMCLIASVPPYPPYQDSPTTIQAKVVSIGREYEVDIEVMDAVVRCESEYNPSALGDGGKSRGLVQIYAPAHPHITDEQAYDPDFALRFLAENLKQGKGRLWTCWRWHVAQG